MKSRQFSVPVDSMLEFAEAIENSGLTNTIVGTSGDDEMIVEVSYDSDERAAVFELMEIVEPEDE
ncbi:MAG: hypothetical protein WCM76_06625 [Bacteroidota bacterium]